MPFNPANASPGVYVFEAPSGVHTITGVATSITAFIGRAKSGPVNVATRVLSFADYERSFGGLAPDSLMSYAVQQFFLNGGSDSWIVRVAGQGIGTAAVDVPSDKDAQGNTKIVLQVSELSAGGPTGRTTSVFIDRDPDLPDGTHSTTFTLAVVNAPTPPTSTTSAPPPPPNAPNDAIVEIYKGLSMKRTDPNYVVKKVNGQSKLIKVKDKVLDDTTLPATTPNNHGSLTSGTIAVANITKWPHIKDTSTKPPTESGQSFRITLDNTTPYTITPLGTGSDKKFTDIGDAATAIKNAVQALQKKGDPAFDGFTCIQVTDEHGTKKDQLKLSSGSFGSTSSVTVLALADDNLADFLQLSGTRGTQTHAVGLPLQSNSTETVPGPGTPGSPSPGEFDMFIGTRSKFEGIYALDKVDLVNLICLPGVVDPSILSFVDAYCKERRSFMIVDAPEGLIPNDMYTEITGTHYGSLKTDHGAIYYPRPKLPDQLDNGNLRTFPPCGIIAGLYARIDGNRGVWKSAAGTEATLTGVQGFEYMLNNGENGILNSQGVNCLRFFPVYGFVDWGARTLLGSDDAGSEYKYVAVRRTALYLEESLLRGLQWVVFEPNDEPLWAQIRLNVGAFMQDLFRKGAFQGKTPRDAYFVKCDGETTTQEDIDRGIVNIVVGFAPLKPAEFVVITVQQIAGQLQV